MGHAVVTKHEPGHPDFDAQACIGHLERTIDGHVTPGGLISWWRMPKNIARLRLFTGETRQRLEQRYEERLEAINAAGPR